MIVTIIIWIVLTSGPTSFRLTSAVIVARSPSSSSTSFLNSSPFSSSSSFSPSSLSLSLPELFGSSGDSDGGRVSLRDDIRDNRKVTNPTMETLMGTMMELASGGYTLLLVPPAKDNNISKRDPLDVGAGRGYTGSLVINSLRGQTASSDPIGPGKRNWKKMRATAPMSSGFNNPTAVMPNGDY